MSARDLETAITIAEEAGAILLEHWRARDRLDVTHKRAGDFVSQADVAAERHIKSRLAALFPDDAWLGEETGGSDDAAPRRWIVDPLDGTTNFLRGIPHWAVSIALEVEGVLTVGVVHSPAQQETFAARIGGTATLNGAPMAPAHTATLEPALFGTGIPFGTMPHIDDHAADIARLMPHCAGVRRMGAAALDLAYVAAGRLDGFWERRLQPWDIAAGLVLVRQSGARVEGWTRAEPPEQSGTVITAPPALFDAFVGIIRGG
ncbi:Inositol-1-monophosphatase [Roseivivax sp. THAF40]|uniref:inositol monophosphatase family protein n=1 Tax=unclassified Roseivivax TaxID=2639302 RepID=UPI001268C668|nr:MULTISPECIES: inositol monophosphatase family protein [unclassified Roseivivax]QFS81808.1 Inositol-1-monophosphatase [Roseivivax sp. THAF197b]QFT45608.1 Inositol-1-monophosphatase [Roseivivax sp. THAF40]